MTKWQKQKVKESLEQRIDIAVPNNDTSTNKEKDHQLTDDKPPTDFVFTSRT